MIGAVATALVPVLFAYGGWQQTNFIAEELIEPERNLPRALVLGVVAVVLVYVLANVAYLSALGVDGLAASTGARRRHDVGAARAGGSSGHHGGDRLLDLRVPEPRHPGDAARLPGDGGRRALLRAVCPAASEVPDAGRRPSSSWGSGRRCWSIPGSTARCSTTWSLPTGSSSAPRRLTLIVFRRRDGRAA